MPHNPRINHTHSTHATSRECRHCDELVETLVLAAALSEFAVPPTRAFHRRPKRNVIARGLHLPTHARVVALEQSNAERDHATYLEVAMQALDAQTPHLPDTRVLSEQRRVPVYASPFDKPAGAWGEDGPGTAVTPGYNDSVDRFNDMFNFVSAATVAPAFQRGRH